MAPHDYQTQAHRFLSAVDDSAKLPICMGEIINLIWLARDFDLQKRQAFYTKKPDSSRHDRYLQEVAALTRSLQDAGVATKTYGEVQNTITPNLLHALLGLVTEVGELWEEVMKAMAAGRPVDLNCFREELGDLEWYMAECRTQCEHLDGDWGRFSQANIQAANIAKLTTRYPREAGAVQAGGDRDLQAEQAAMDAAVPSGAPQP